MRISNAPQLIRRLAAGFGANVVGKIWVTLIQVISIPLLTHKWGATGFGTWIMLSTIPSYISLTAAGFSSAAAVDMTRSFSLGKKAAYVATLQSIWVLLSGISLAVLSASVIFVFACLEVFRDKSPQTTYAALVLIAYSCVVIQSSLVHAIYRSSLRYALGTLLLDAFSFLEGLSVLFFSAIGKGILFAAASMLAIRIFSSIFMYIWIKSRENWIRIGFEHANKSDVYRLLHPSLGSLTIAFSNALTLQGVVLGLGFSATPAVAASFSTARTIARIPLQISDLVGRATLQELTRAYSTGDSVTFNKLSLINIISALAILVPTTLVIAIFGSEIGRVMGHGALVFEPLLFPALAFTTLVQGVNLSAGQTLVAINRQHQFGYAYLALCAATACSPWVWRHTENPATNVAATTALCEVVTISLIVYLVRKYRRRQQLMPAT